MATNSLNAPAPAAAPRYTTTNIPAKVVIPGKGNDAPGGSGGDYQSAAADKRKQEILADAKRQCERIKQETKEKVQELESSSNQLYVHPDGSVKPGVDREQTARVEQEGEAREKKVMEEAERRAAQVR